jgi:hypothetical protein
MRVPDLLVTAYKTIFVYQCKCQSIAHLLVSNGLFPMSPKAPRRAVSIMLLDFYRAIYEKSSDAVYAFSGALDNHYRRRGFSLRTSKVQLTGSSWFNNGLMYSRDYLLSMDFGVD